MITVTPLDLLLIYLGPLFLGFLVLFFLSILLYLLIISPLEFVFKKDVHWRYARFSSRPFGKKYTLSYFYFVYTFIVDRGLQAIFLYRISNFFLRKKQEQIAFLIQFVTKLLTNIDISPYASLGYGVEIWHGAGVVIGRNTRIGDRTIICQQVTTGAGWPDIGNDVFIGAGAKLLGDIKIGDGAKIGANAVVLVDVPPGCTAVGVAARVIKKEKTEISKEESSL